MSKQIIIAEYITEHLSYDSVTGLITNTKTGKTYTDATDKHGYIRIGLRHRITNVPRMVFAHRIAWFLHHGTEPNIIDHQNTIRTDNRITNLISSTFKANNQNKQRYKNSILMVGVRKSGNKFEAQVYSRITNKKTNIGTYHTEKDAHFTAVRYKQLHCNNYLGADLTPINGSMHPFFIPNMLEAAVNTIEDTKGKPATFHINNK